MFKELRKKINDREYLLYLNNKNINITSKRINGLKSQFDSLITNGEINPEKSFFIYNEKNLATFGLSYHLDIVWVNYDDKIIHIEEDFIENKISKEIENTKFIYIFSSGTIKKKEIILNGILKHIYKR